MIVNQMDEKHFFENQNTDTENPEYFTKPPEHFLKIKENLLKEFPKEKIEGINLERVEDFIREQGLTVKPYIIFNGEDLPKIKKITNELNLYPKNIEKNEACATYSPHIDLVFLKREKECEAVNGAIYTERVLLHELEHAANSHQVLVYDNNEFSVPRSGFCLPGNKIPQGWFLEEGWAEMQAGKYFERFANNQELAKLKESLGAKDANVGLNDTVQLIIDEKVIPLPMKYLIVEPKGDATITRSAFAAYGMELLCEKDPNLFQIMTKARSSAEGLHKLALAIDKIAPGLFTEISKPKCTDKEFEETLLTIIEKIHGGMENVIKAKGRLREQWDEYLSKQKKAEK